MTAGRRTFLGRHSNIITRVRVYDTNECLEVDEYTFTEVVRRRVYYDDVLMVTRHTAPGAWLLAFAGFFTVIFGLVTVAVYLESAVGGTIMLFLTLPFAAIFALRLARPVNVITVCGKRSTAVMKFWLRREWARRIFSHLKAKTQRKQEEVAGIVAAQQPPPPPEPPEPLAGPSWESKFPPQDPP